MRLLYIVNDDAQLVKALLFLKAFEKSVVQIYGIYIQTYNLHVFVKHIEYDVRQHGSLKCHSMFSFEGSLGQIKKAVHGTRGFAEQFIKSIK